MHKMHFDTTETGFIKFGKKSLKIEIVIESLS